MAKLRAGKAFRIAGVDILVTKTRKERAWIVREDGKREEVNATTIEQGIEAGLVTEIKPTWKLLQWKEIV